jgi:Putative ER transporter, 6TM, N-terminal
MFPQIMIPSFIFSIVVTVSCSTGPMIPTLTFGYSFIESLLKAIYIGLGVGTGVSLIFVPIASRTLVYKQFTGLLTTFQNCLKTYKEFNHSLENEEAINDLLISDMPLRPEVAAVRIASQAVVNLHAKLQVDLPFAKREAGLGTMDADQLKKLNNLTRLVMLPIIGLSTISEILKSFASVRGWDMENVKNLSEEDKEERARAVKDWASNMRLVRESVSEIIDIMIDSIDHVMYQLGFKKRPKSSQSANSDDVEGKPDETAPGSPGFAAYLDAKSNEFYSTKHLTLIEWGRKRGFQFPDDFFDNPAAELIVSDEIKNEGDARRKQNQRQLYLLLYVSIIVLLPNFPTYILNRLNFSYILQVEIFSILYCGPMRC